MNADRTLAAIRADAATSDAEGRRDLAGHLADFRAALLDEAALIAAADRSRFDSEVATLTATRDIVIGQRETAQRERDEARGLLHALTADLNATREKLATAEAFRDSLQAEVNEIGAVATTLSAERDTLRAEVADFFAAAVAVAQALDDGGSLGPAGGERDPRAWVTFARGLADRVGSRVEQAVGNGDNLEAAHEHLATLRAEVDKLRARPVLTVGMYRARIDSLPGRAEQVVALLGPVTLPAQDAAAALWKAIDDQIVVEAEKVRDGSGVDWHSAYSGAIGTRAKAEAIVRAALAKLGAQATTPSKPADVSMRNALVSIGPKAALAEASQAQRAEVLAVDVEPYELLPGIYRHFKGGLYTVALVARQEGNGERVVVYQGALGVWWTRPFDEFTGKVQTVEGAVPRFARVSP